MAENVCRVEAGGAAGTRVLYKQERGEGRELGKHKLTRRRDIQRDLQLS